MPWQRALHLPAQPVLLLPGRSRSGDAAAARGQLTLWRGFGRDPLFVADSTGADSEAVRDLLPLGARVHPLPPARSLWRFLAGLTADPIVLAPVRGLSPDRVRVVLLLHAACQTGADDVLIRPEGRPDAAWPCFMGRAALRALARHPEKAARMPARAVRAAIGGPAMDGAVDEETARRLLESTGPNAFLLAHSLAVARAARALAIHLRLRGRAVSPKLASACGLVHDIAKGLARHELAGAAWLDFLDLPVMARCVARHSDLTLPDHEPVTERELVYLADKYCQGGHCVPLAERFGRKLALFSSQGRACANIGRRLARARAMERRLADEMGAAPLNVVRQALDDGNDNPRLARTILLR